MTRYLFAILLMAFIIVADGYYFSQAKSRVGFVARPIGRESLELKNDNRYSAKSGKSIYASSDLNIDTPGSRTWKTYSNDKYGFSFQYPTVWVKRGNDVPIGDRSGNTAGISINFIDTISNSTLSVDYHAFPYGLDFYNYVLSQFNSSLGWYATERKQIKVGESEAIQAITEITVNGKGNPINPPLRIIVIDFLDKRNNGEIELQFRSTLPTAVVEVDRLKKLLSTFRFIN